LKIRIPKLAKDSFYVTAAQGVTYLTGGLWGIFLARWLGTDFFGMYLYYAGIFGIASALGEFGTIGFLMRELNTNEKPKDVFTFYLNKQFYVIAFLALGSFLFIRLTEKDVAYRMLGISAFLFLYFDSLTNVAGTWFFSKQRAPFISNMAILKSSGTLLAGFLIYKSAAPLYYLLFAPALFSLVRLIFIMYTICKAYEFSFIAFLTQRFHFNDIKVILSKTWVFGMFTIMSVLQAQTNPIILKLLDFNPHVLGIVGAANRIRNIINMSGGAILQVVFPKLSKDYSGSPELFSRNFITIFKPLFVLNLLICALVICFSKDIILVLLGDEYADSIPYMMLFAVGCITPVLMLLSSAVIAAGKEKKTLVFSSIYNVSVPVLKLILIPVTGSIFIGWIGAFGPWTNLIIFFALLYNVLVPKLKFDFYIKIILLIAIGILVPVFLIYIDINRFVVSTIVFFSILITGYYLSFLNLKEIFVRGNTK